MRNIRAAGLMWGCRNAAHVASSSSPGYRPGKRWQTLKKFLKTNKTSAHDGYKRTNGLHMGHIPFFFRQRALVNITGKSLRPGGIRLTRSAVDYCDFKSKDPVLDAGCGYGITTRYLLEEYGIMSIGADISPDMLEDAKGKAMKTRCTESRFVRSELPVLPFKSRSFKGIFCECVFSLIQKKSACLEEFFRILKKNGKLVLTDLYIPERFKTHRTGEKSKKGKNSWPPPSCLDGASTILELIDLLEGAGFRIDIMEDHTPFLKKLTGLMLFQHGSPDNFRNTPTGFQCDTSPSSTCTNGALKPGYCMIIAGKYD